MPTQIALPTSSYQDQDKRTSSKRLLNVFSESMPQDSRADTKQFYPNPSITVRRWPGTNLITTLPEFPVRGFTDMAGQLFIVAGTGLYTAPSLGGPFTLAAQGIQGTGLVRMTNNKACVVVLVPGNASTAIGYTWTSGTGLQKITAGLFTAAGALDCFFMDTFIVFVSGDGSGFFNDDGTTISGSGPITFTTDAVFPREFGTDLFVNGANDHREAVFLGRTTGEGFINAGNPVGTPFSTAPNSFITIGMHQQAAYSLALQDQSLFWVASDRTVRRRNGQTPVRVSTSGIENILKAANLQGCYALTPTIAGHPMWVLNMPAEPRSIAYDCLTNQWFEVSSYGYGYWRALSFITYASTQIVGDGYSGNIGILDTTKFQEYGNPIVCELETQSVYDNHNRIVHRRLELLSTSGQPIDYSTNPGVTLLKSDDGGVSFIPHTTKYLGNLGQYQTRAHWHNLGTSRDRVYKFRFSDQTPSFTVDIIAELEGGKW